MAVHQLTEEKNLLTYQYSEISKSVIGLEKHNIKLEAELNAYKHLEKSNSSRTVNQDQQNSTVQKFLEEKLITQEKEIKAHIERERELSVRL